MKITFNNNFTSDGYKLLQKYLEEELEFLPKV